MLSLSVSGLSWSTYEELGFIGVESIDVVPVDLHIDLSKPTGRGRTIMLTGRLSCIDLTLTYTAYLLLRDIMRNNVSREVDAERWDNIEKAYSIELEELEYPPGVFQGDHLAYSSDARFIRYGRNRQQKRSVSVDRIEEENPESSSASQEASPMHVTTVDCAFEIQGLRLKLHRNDSLDDLGDSASPGRNVDPAFNYDMVVFRADKIAISIGTTAAGDKSMQLTLNRLGIFDLGDFGRLARERYYYNLSRLYGKGDVRNRSIRDPCSFSVLAEGYSRNESHSALEETSQLIVTVDWCSASSVGHVGGSSLPDDGADDKIVVARIVINYLTINAMIRPMKEIASFLACSWDVQHDGHVVAFNRVISSVSSNEAAQLEGSTAPMTSRKGFQLKLVAHYPQIFFLADESDPNSRALVLRG